MFRRLWGRGAADKEEEGERGSVCDDISNDKCEVKSSAIAGFRSLRASLKSVECHIHTEV